MATATDEQQILALLEAQAAAIRNRDARAAVAPYAAELVKFDLAPPLRTAGAAARDEAALAKWMAGFDGPLVRDLGDLEIVVSGDLALCYGVIRIGATTHEGEAWRLWLRATFGLRRTNGAWKITHEHESVPFHMDGSFRAATDLEP